ncbi:MAG: DUF2914 domain-containing protein [Planctomycetes bacterium]|nr:DUF2914 domain-containing protein [Planctomycetota bacterium]
MKKKLVIGTLLILGVLMLSYVMMSTVGFIAETDTLAAIAKEKNQNLTPPPLVHNRKSNENIIELNCWNDEWMGSSPTIYVPRAVICLGIKDQMPIGRTTLLASDTNHVFCWAQIANGLGKKIRYIWYLEGQTYASQWIKIDNNRFRTWCKKNINSKSSGSGVVEIVDETGRVLKTVDFNIIHPSRRAKQQYSGLSTSGRAPY